MQSDIAFLAYYPEKKRSDNNSFEGNYNIGANVIMDVLRRKEIVCDICTPDTAHNYSVVLISITSEYDCIALYEELYSTVRQAAPKNRVIVVFQSTPFRPSVLTPLQWAPNDFNVLGMKIIKKMEVKCRKPLTHTLQTAP